MGYTVALQHARNRHPHGARSRIVGMVLHKGMLLTGIGLTLGIAGSVASTRYLAHQFQYVAGFDAMTYAGVLALTVAAGPAACIAPERRAAKVEGLEAIRCE